VKFGLSDFSGIVQVMAGVEVRFGLRLRDRVRWGAFQGVQGATVLHRLARLYQIGIQGATKCNRGCYIFSIFKENGFEPSVEYSTENSEEPAISIHHTQSQALTELAICRVLRRCDPKTIRQIGKVCDVVRK
jgi:hypothetical protein